MRFLYICFKNLCMNPFVQKEILKSLDMLDETKQEKVLAYIKSLYQESKESILDFVNNISEPDLLLMKKAIQENCGNIDYNEW